MSMLQKRRRWLVHLFLILFCALTLAPVVMVARKAVSPGKDFDLSLNPIPQQVTSAHFRKVIGATDDEGRWLFGRQLFNSLVVALATTVIGVLLSCSAAYAFSRFRFPGRRAGLLLLLVVQMFPAMLLLIPIYVILSHLGLLNHLGGLVLVYATTSLPFCVWMLKGYFDTIPKDLEEAALIDGASRMRIFFTIVLPLARPALAITALFAFMTAWNEYILAATFLNREASYTLPVLLKSFVGEHGTADWGAFAAGAIIVSIPVVALFYALQKHLVGGLTAGAVK